MIVLSRLLRKAKRMAGRVRERIVPHEHRLMFAFPGSAGAWPGMGRELYRHEPVFREAIDAAGAVVEEVLGWPAAATFRGEDDASTTPELERRNEIIHLGKVQLAQEEL